MLIAMGCFLGGPRGVVGRDVFREGFWGSTPPPLENFLNLLGFSKKKFQNPP